MTVKSENLYPVLRQLMQDGEVRFAYRKKTGELRVAKGTTNLEHIPAESHPTGAGPEKTNTQAYWDLNVNGWRAFNPLCLVWVENAGQTALTQAETDIINETLKNL